VGGLFEEIYLSEKKLFPAIGFQDPQYPAMPEKWYQVSRSFKCTRYILVPKQGTAKIITMINWAALPQLIVAGNLVAQHGFRPGIPLGAEFFLHEFALLHIRAQMFSDSRWPMLQQKSTRESKTPLLLKLQSRPIFGRLTRSID
jgi:hypothetical protein